MDSNDILLWPCGTACFREDLAEYSHKSDDYMTISITDPDWAWWVERL